VDNNRGDILVDGQFRAVPAGLKWSVWKKVKHFSKKIGEVINGIKKFLFKIGMKIMMEYYYFSNT
jgi:hypothetical protein